MRGARDTKRELGGVRKGYERTRCIISCPIRSDQDMSGDSPSSADMEIVML
jgi:hypothetical protein